MLLRFLPLLLMLTGGCAYDEKLGGSWLVRHRSTGLIEAGDSITSLHRRSGSRTAKVDDYLLSWRYYGDDCVLYQRAGPRVTYAVCGGRKPILVRRGAWPLRPEGYCREGAVVVRDGVVWRKRQCVPTDVIKARAMAAPPYAEDWHSDVDRSAEMPVSETERRLATDERDDSGRTPLMDSVAQRDAREVEALIMAGADVNARDKDGYTPLMLAVQRLPKPDDAIGRLLIQSRAAVNVGLADGETPLIRAAMEGHTDTAILLIEAGADVNAHTNRGDSALGFAKQSNNDRLLAALRAARVSE